MKAKKAYEGKNSLWRRLADTVSIYSFGGTPQEAEKGYWCVELGLCLLPTAYLLSG